MGNYEYATEDTHKYKPFALNNEALENMLSKLTSIRIEPLGSPVIEFQKMSSPQVNNLQVLDYL